MAQLKLIQNGIRKTANRKRRRKNPTTRTTVARKAANPRKRRRRSRNGIAAAAPVVRRVTNGRRRRHTKRRSRNGVTMRRVNNGLFGNSKETVTSVVSLLVGLGATKVESSILTPIASNLLGNLGMGYLAKPLIEAGAAVTVNKWAAEAIKKGSGKYVMIGGLAMALMSLLEQFLPSTSAYNPFASSNGSPIVLNQPQITNAGALAGSSAMGIPVRRPMNYRRPAFTY
jgi:hypothetical protein